MFECIACGGSGKRSRGNKPCGPCKGTGALEKPDELELDPGGAYHVSQHSSESNEHYTTPDIIEAARELMGGIDLDPASCPMAQETVQATAWYGPGSPFGEDGLAEPAAGRVWLNPPGGLVPDEYKGMGTQSFAALWWAAYSSMWQEGEIDQMVFLGFTLEILRSTQGLDVPWPGDFPICIPSSRIKFDTVNKIRTKGKKKGQLIDPSKPPGVRVKGDSPTHANVVVWLPPIDNREAYARQLDDGSRDLFEATFSDIGACRI